MKLMWTQDDGLLRRRVLVARGRPHPHPAVAGAAPADLDRRDEGPGRAPLGPARRRLADHAGDPRPRAGPAALDLRGRARPRRPPAGQAPAAPRDHPGRDHRRGVRAVRDRWPRSGCSPTPTAASPPATPTRSRSSSARWPATRPSSARRTSASRRSASYAATFPIDPILVRAQWPHMTSDEVVAYLDDLGRDIVPAVAELESVDRVVRATPLVEELRSKRRTGAISNRAHRPATRCGDSDRVAGAQPAPLGRQRGDLRVVVAELGEDRARVRARSTAGGGTGVSLREKRGVTAGWWCSPSGSGTYAERATACGCARASSRSSTGVTQDSTPSKAAVHSSRRAGGEHRGERGAQRRPLGAVLVRTGRARERPRTSSALRKNLSSIAPNAIQPAVGAGVDVVVGAAGVEQVRAALVGPAALRAQPVHQPHQGRGRLQHVGVDDLADAGAAHLEQRADHAEGQRRRAPAEVADQVERRRPVARRRGRCCAARR